MPHRRRAFGALSLALAAPLVIGTTVESGAADRSGDVVAIVTGLRSTKGQVLACMTARPKAFPGCEKDPAARTLIVKAGKTVELDFGPAPRGRYAISVVHDENANGRMDKKLMMPAEGYGFSRDAPVRMGPPRFADAAFDVREGKEQLWIKMRYMF